jgi:hypothetical protein
MALSQAFVAAHIQHWQAQLNQPWYNHRRHWPECLFHHAPLENAAAILAAGMLRSRNDPANPQPRDVAAREVNATRAHAHNRVRLYFRPKTPTQYHIEGIRKPGECRFGDETHAPVLVMFILDAQRILTMPNTQFCDRNMQRVDAVPSDTEAYFAATPFAKVYHEGPTGGDETIIYHRCAEVLPQSPLDLEYCLKSVFVRSDPERDTLLNLLGPHRARWASRCHVSDALKVSEKRYSFVQEIGMTREGVTFLLNPRDDRRGVKISIQVWDEANRFVVRFDHTDLQAAPPQGRWIYNHAFADGLYRVRCEIEDHLAYDAQIPLGPVLF